MSSSPETLLREGLQQMQLAFSDTCQQKLLRYIGLMEKWNQHMNLSGHRELAKMVPYHLLDSLSIYPYLKGHIILDVGTGAGLPGIPLAIVDPDRQYVLLDSRSKRLRFVREVCRQLDLTNVSIVDSRIEDHQMAPTADTIVARAVAEAGKLIGLTDHLLSENGQWLLMKGQNPTAEMNGLNHTFQIKTLSVPFLAGQRKALFVQKKS